MRVLLRRSFPIFLLFIVPLTLHAAAEVRFPATEAVTRGDFIRAAVQALRLPLKDEGKLPYRRAIPSALWPSVRTALEFDALAVFGEELNPGKAITRGEAVQVLVKLTRVSPEGRAKVYGDVTNDTASRAIQAAVERGWIRPLRATIFGADRPLLGREANLLLKRAAPASTPQRTTIEVVPDRAVRIKTKEKTPLPNDEMLRTIWQLLNEEFLYPDKIQSDEAAYRAAEAIVESLDDPYTTFMRPLPAKEFQNQLDGQVTGIGAQVEFKDRVLIIVAPLKGSPAEHAGLKAGDQILKVNGESLEGLDFLQSVNKVRGPKGSTAVLWIRRDGVEFEVTVVRDTIVVPEIEISWQGNVAVVKLMQFGGRTDRELRGLLTEVQAKNPKGLILDLRNNPGGLLHAADTVVGNFVPKGSKVAVIATRSEEHAETTTDVPTIAESVPMVVLVNKGSASASEIVAGALQDHKRATILGMTTFGKGTVQQIMEFRDGSGLKMTVAEWFTPSRRKIDGIGVTPDIVVEDSDGRDEQMLKALEVLR